jgi:hypothetical protein
LRLAVAPQGRLTVLFALPKVKLVPPEVAVTVPQVVPEVVVMLTVKRQLVPALAWGEFLGVGDEVAVQAGAVSASASSAAASSHLRMAGGRDQRDPPLVAATDRFIVSVHLVRRGSCAAPGRRPR